MKSVYDAAAGQGGVWLLMKLVKCSVDLFPSLSDKTH